MKTFKRLVSYILTEKKLIFAGLILTALIGFTEVVTGAVLKLLTNSVKNIGEFFVAGDKSAIEIPLKLKVPSVFMKKKIVILDTVLKGEDAILAGMITLAAVFTVIYLVQVLSDYFRDISLGTANQRIMRNVKKQIFNKVVSLPEAEFQKEKPGDLMSRVTYDSMVLSNLMNILVEVVRSLVYILIFIPLMFVISWKTALFTTIFFPLTFVIIKWFSKVVKKSSKQVTDSTADYTAFLEDKIKNLPKIREEDHEKEEMETFGKLVDSNYVDNVKLIFFKSALKPTNEFLGIFGLSIASVFFSYLIVDRNFDPGNAVLFLYMMKTSYKPFKKVAQASGELFNSIVCAEKIFKLLDR